MYKPTAVLQCEFLTEIDLFELYRMEDITISKTNYTQMQKNKSISG